MAPGDPRDPDGDGVVTVNDARICTLRITRLYARFADTPCVSSGFPEQVPQLPVCPLRAGSAPPSNVDLNLFFYVSEAALAGTLFPTTLNVVESGDASGVRIRTDPPRDTVFNIVGQSAAIGAMQACSTSDLKHCVAPDLPEGSQLDVRVNFVSPGGSLRFTEQGGFVEDTVPPTVQSLNVSFDAAGGLAATLTATDATTSPIGAEFWYSLDNGVSWNSVTLRPTTDILDGIPTRAFRGKVGPFEHGKQIRYFASVQDEVFNRTYVGTGTAIVP